MQQSCIWVQFLYADALYELISRRIIFLRMQHENSKWKSPIVRYFFYKCYFFCRKFAAVRRKMQILRKNWGGVNIFPGRELTGGGLGSSVPCKIFIPPSVRFTSSATMGSIRSRFLTTSSCSQYKCMKPAFCTWKFQKISGEWHPSPHLTPFWPPATQPLYSFSSTPTLFFSAAPTFSTDDSAACYTANVCH